MNLIEKAPAARNRSELMFRRGGREGEKGGKNERAQEGTKTINRAETQVVLWKTAKQRVLRSKSKP